MFVLRDAHKNAFSQAAAESFEQRMFRDVQARFPHTCARLGDAAIRERISAAVKEAGSGECAEEEAADAVRHAFALEAAQPKR